MACLFFCGLKATCFKWLQNVSVREPCINKYVLPPRENSFFLEGGGEICFAPQGEFIFPGGGGGGEGPRLLLGGRDECYPAYGHLGDVPGGCKSKHQPRETPWFGFGIGVLLNVDPMFINQPVVLSNRGTCSSKRNCSPDESQKNTPLLIPWLASLLVVQLGPRFGCLRSPFGNQGGL